MIPYTTRIGSGGSYVGCIYSRLVAGRREHDASVRCKGVGRCGIALRLEDFELGDGQSEGAL